MPIEILPFTPDFLPEASILLAQRHQKDRAVFPELPSRYEDPQQARVAIERALKRPLAAGFAALEQGRLRAYLVGDMLIDNQWGRSAWVRTAGCAYDPAVGVEKIRHLYAALGAHWVGYGVFTHCILVPNSDQALVQAWFSLSFGIEQVHSLMRLKNRSLPAVPPDIQIRAATPGDKALLAEMSDVIWKTQIKAPVWGAMLPENVSDNVNGWLGLLDETDTILWLAFKNERVMSVQGYWPAEKTEDNLMLPEDCAHLSVAATRPEARGQGIGTLITQYGLVQAQAAGYKFCETDWRSTNLLSSRFWPGQGFMPLVYRLVRRIDQRILWANGGVTE